MKPPICKAMAFEPTYHGFEHLPINHQHVYHVEGVGC